MYIIILVFVYLVIFSPPKANRPRTDSTGHHNPSSGGLLKQSLMHNRAASGPTAANINSGGSGNGGCGNSEKSTDSGSVATVPYNNRYFKLLLCLY